MFVEFMFWQEIGIFEFTKTDVALVVPVGTVGAVLAWTELTAETHAFNLDIFV